MKDQMFIHDLEVSCRVGTTPEERAFPQVARIGVQAQLDLEKAGKSDNLIDSVDYAVLVEEIRKGVEKVEFNLVEAVAERTAEVVLNHKQIKSVSISVTKNVFPGVAGVGVSIYRSQK